LNHFSAGKKEYILPAVNSLRFFAIILKKHTVNQKYFDWML